MNAAPLYLRAEENGIASVTVQAASSPAGYASMMAWRLALGRGSEAPNVCSASLTYASSLPFSGRTSVTSMPPSVSVPVLSRQTTSTRARPSMAGSSCTRHCLRPRRTTPMAKATEVRSTRPSGIIGTMPPTVRATESLKLLSFTTSWLMISPIAVGTIIHVTYFRIVLMPLRSSEWTSVKRDASSASCAAYASRPTFVAVNAPPPATTKLPDITGSPVRLSTGSASPVSSDSSISRLSASATTPSTTTLSPGPSSTRSPRTISEVEISAATPSRRTVGFASPITARLSRVRLARHSWMIPMPVLATITKPKRLS
ncbi:hypothetical protein GA0115255_125222 [Streptomyces sp. Ncost-T6T-2b]|nr:hypothetical protein GA0115255_125222 [Streptomyces sp. Ncost-T6T-2b]